MESETGHTIPPWPGVILNEQRGWTAIFAYSDLTFDLVTRRDPAHLE